MPARVRFAVVIPMFDEEAGAEKCVRTVMPVLEGLAADSVLIAVDDGSRDRTREVLARLEPEFPRLVVVDHETNRGYGQALVTGSARAAADGFDYTLFMDSDLTNDPVYIPSFVERMAEGFEVIKASRYIPRGGVEGVPFGRWAISYLGNRIAKALYGLPLHDCTNGFRAVKTSVLREMRLAERGFPVTMEELWQAKFLATRFCEVPYVLTSRTGDVRPSSFRYRPKVFFDYLKYAVKAACQIAPPHLAGRTGRRSSEGTT